MYSLPDRAGRRERKGNTTRRTFYQYHRWLRVAWVYWCIRPRSESEPARHLAACRAQLEHLCAKRAA